MPICILSTFLVLSILVVKRILPNVIPIKELGKKSIIVSGFQCLSHSSSIQEESQPGRLSHARLMGQIRFYLN